MVTRTALRRCAVPLLLAVLVAAGCSSSSKKDNAATTTTSTVAAPKDIQIGAGTNDPKDPNIAVLAFMPASVSVEVGTPVNWQWTGTEPHSVTFLAPGTTLPEVGSKASQALYAPPTPPKGAYDGTTLVNSGLQPLGAPATPLQMTFSKAGTYSYYCLIHPQMKGTITVTDPGGQVDTPATVAQRRAADEAKYLAEGQAAKAKLLADPVVKTKNANGTTTWTVQMGASTANTDILAFAPTPAGVKAGDTVTFVNTSTAPHTASFNVPPTLQGPDDPANVPTPAKSPGTVTATGFTSTGTLPPNTGPSGAPLAARTYSFVVPAAGTYSYVCIFHAPSNMVGTITAT